MASRPLSVERAAEFAAATADAAAAFDAQRAKTERLRSLRLAREASEARLSAQEAKPKPIAKTRLRRALTKH
jgi:hypothetical protein